MSNESMMRIFKINDGKTTANYPIRDSHINIAYGECITAAATAAKVVVLTDDPGWKLKAGSKVTVKFTYAVPANATLNVAGTGAKNIYFNGSRIGSLIAAGDVVTFDYDGTQYIVTSISSVLANVGNKLNIGLKGAANGLAELDSSGKVPSSQLPSYVDDVLEYAARSDFPNTGEAGKIYVDKTANLTYRWSGSAYVEISQSLALGETSSTAYRGDRGKTAYDHATAKGSAFASGLYKITTNAQGHVTAATAVAKSDITALGIPGSDTNTHRPIQLNGTQILGDNTTALNLKAGSNVSVTNSDGTVTISATDTTYSSKVAASGGTDVSLVTTGEKYAWNAKTSNTGTVTSVATGIGLTGGTITGSGTIKAKLKTETAATNDSANASNTSGRQYPVVQDKSGYLSVNVPWTDSKPVTSVAGKTGAVTLAKGDVGLDNVDNKSSATIRSEITSSNVTTALGFTPLNAALKGANSGVAELDTNGKVPSSQLPSFVDDVLEYDKSSSFPTTGETGKIYIAQDTNKTYRWSGTAYVEISASLALGETSSTAYRGDRGKTAYDHAAAKGSAFTSGLYKITTNAQGHVTAATAVAKSDITALGIPGSNTNTTYTLTQDSSDGHKLTFTGSDGTSVTFTIPDNNTTYTLSSLGIGNVKNYDQSKAIKAITRSGTTFTYTCLDGTTGTFTQQDTNTWTAMVGATSSANGTAGYVPAPPKDGYNTKYLRADGKWTVPPDTTYSAITNAEIDALFT